ncbi:MAG: serine/threonine protein kinase, partial [Planctomycetota bacterium]|nr:serine/threonine protein kinase [Planctomycetota bacterium]
MRAPLRLGAYTVIGELARGGMGVVHEALHEPTGARHALKTLLPGAEPDEVARFRREAELLGRIDHPNVVRVHAADLAGRPPWLALELLTGGSLQDRLAHGPLAPEEALALGATLARALAHAHARGVLHRDLKPSNVVFDERGEPRLVDFGLGLAAAGGQRLTRTGSILGTPAFMAPEQAEGLKAEDERTDVYGLGALLYAALAGRPPFEGGQLAVLQAVLGGAVTPLVRLRPGLSPALVAVVERAMARQPEDRFATAEALPAALEAASSRGLRARR